jgi:putative N6-adenine-specific DNA methylase
MAESQLLDAFIITAPGIESITARELRGLGIEAGEVERGGVSFRGSMEALYATNLRLRTATRIVVRIAQFHASSFAELERRAKKIDWARWLPPKGDVKFRVTCRKSRLYHSDAVAERMMTAAAKSGANLNFDVAAKDDESADSANTEQLFIVRLTHDEVSVSIDSSGDLLHRRGYRPESTRASLRETLAAAMLLGSGWKPGSPLLDPLCGSGTIPIEAALIARNIAPGIARPFAFQRWRSFDEKLWSSVLTRSREAQLENSATAIYGGDRDAGAVEVAERNADRAGVGKDVEFHRRPLAESLDALADSGGSGAAVITNPPYGMRVSTGSDLRNLYGMLGARAEKNRWSLGILTSDEKLAKQSKQLKPVFKTQNGGIPVTFFSGGNGAESE